MFEIEREKKPLDEMNASPAHIYSLWKCINTVKCAMASPRVHQIIIIIRLIHFHWNLNISKTKTSNIEHTCSGLPNVNSKHTIRKTENSNHFPAFTNGPRIMAFSVNFSVVSFFPIIFHSYYGWTTFFAQISYSIRVEQYNTIYRHSDDRLCDFHFVFVIGTHKPYQTLW